MFEKHKGSKSRLYSIWTNMKSRCNNKSVPKYKVYGGRGIIVCAEWNNSFTSFRDWAIANGYSDKLTIDRINPNGNYTPTNCRWISIKQQENNRTNNHLLTYKGVTKTMKQWAETIGISYNCLQMRINTYGYTVEEALESKKHKRGKEIV